MVRSRLKNKYLKNMSQENKRKYTRQKSYYVISLIKKKLPTAKHSDKL